MDDKPDRNPRQEHREANLTNAQLRDSNTQKEAAARISQFNARLALSRLR
jgi:hypothetical protein